MLRAYPPLKISELIKHMMCPQNEKFLCSTLQRYNILSHSCLYEMNDDHSTYFKFQAYLIKEHQLQKIQEINGNIVNKSTMLYVAGSSWHVMITIVYRALYIQSGPLIQKYEGLCYQHQLHPKIILMHQEMVCSMNYPCGSYVP